MSIDALSRSALGNPQLHAQLEHVASRLLENRAAAVAAVPRWEPIREQARDIRRATLADLDRYLSEFERHVQASGGVAHRAADAEAACRIVSEIADAHGARRIVKGKSMVTEEIGLNAHLEAEGRHVVETDFGEYILQLAGERPSHIVAPAVHKSRADVGRLFADKLGVTYTDDPVALAAHAREVLRGEFRSAEMGVSGANFAVAATGTVVVVENEGNGRLTTTWPRVHVAVTGIEKMVPSVEDLAVLLTLLPRNATGQAMSSYVSFITGPRRTADRGGPEHLHVVLVDNGRSRMLADPVTRDVLTCIRCGACLNTCPVYRQIGGHSYGGVYAGPIGSLLGPGTQPLTSPPDLPFVSTLCGACADVCAVKIDIPRVLLHLRQKAMAGEAARQPRYRRLQRLAFAGWAGAMAGPRGYRLASRAMRVALAPFARRGHIRGLPPPFNAWTQARDFPAPARRTFRESVGPNASSVPADSRTNDAARADSRVAVQPRRGAPSRPEGAPRLAGTPHDQHLNRATGSADLVEQFVARAAAVQATPCVVTSIEQAQRRVAEILAATHARDVLVSGDAWNAPWSIEALSARQHGPTIRATASVERDTCRSACFTADAGITAVSHAIADSGTLVVCSGSEGGRLESLVPPVHVALLDARDIVPDLDAFFRLVRRERRFEASSAVTFITGPSRTADIEFTLTIGVHGPRQLFIVVLAETP